MSISMYNSTGPVLLRFLRDPDQRLDQAQVLADQKKFNTAVLIRSRLAPDMRELASQVRTASDNA